MLWALRKRIKKITDCIKDILGGCIEQLAMCKGPLFCIARPIEADVWWVKTPQCPSLIMGAINVRIMPEQSPCSHLTLVVAETCGKCSSIIQRSETCHVEVADLFAIWRWQRCHGVQWQRCNGLKGSGDGGFMPGAVELCLLAEQVCGRNLE